MMKEERLVREILRQPTKDIRPLVFAVKAATLKLADRSHEEVFFIRNIYREVALELKQNHFAVARQIQRLANCCWDSMNEDQKLKYIGKNLEDICKPMDIVIYLAFYIQYRKPYYHMMSL